MYDEERRRCCDECVRFGEGMKGGDAVDVWLFVLVGFVESERGGWCACGVWNGDDLVNVVDSGC